MTDTQTIEHAPHRRYCLATGESLAVAHVAVLHAPIGVVHEPTSVYIIAASLADRHVQRVQGHVGMQRGRDFPAQDFYASTRR